LLRMEGSEVVVALNYLAMRSAGQGCPCESFTARTARLVEQQVSGVHNRLRPELRLGNALAPGRICEP
jgi:hypothetical protein